MKQLCSELEKDNALLRQELEQLEYQVQEAKEREERIKRQNQSVMNAFTEKEAVTDKQM